MKCFCMYRFMEQHISKIINTYYLDNWRKCTKKKLKKNNGGYLVILCALLLIFQNLQQIQPEKFYVHSMCHQCQHFRIENLLKYWVPRMPSGLLEISFQLQDHFYLYLGATVLQAGATIKLTILEDKQKANQQNLQP